MKKIIYLFLFLTFNAYSQGNKAKEIVNEYINAIGGHDKLESVNSISFEIESTTYPDTSIHTLTKYIKLRPNKFYKKVNVQNKQLEVRFDGENMIVEKEGEVGISGDEFSNLKETYLFEFEIYSHPFVKIEFVGTDKFEDKLCNKIGVFFKEKIMYFDFFSIDTKLLIGRVIGGEFLSKKSNSLKTSYKNYINLGDILFCNKMETSWNDILITKSVIRKIKLSPSVDRFIFAK